MTRHLRAENQASSTIVTCAKTVEQLDAFLAEPRRRRPRRVVNVRREDVEAFLVERQGAGMRPATLSSASARFSSSSSGWRPRAASGRRFGSPPSRPRLRIRMRAAFGVNARADVLAALLIAPKNSLSVADLARTTRFTKPNVAFAVDALVLAGLLETRAVGNERRVTLARAGEILPGLRPPIAQPDWVARFGVALEVLRFEERDGMSPSIRAIEARRVVESLRDRIRSEELPQPNLAALGDDFATAFDQWVVDLVAWLRASS